jgi:hypothetical protein
MFSVRPPYQCQVLLRDGAFLELANQAEISNFRFSRNGPDVFRSGDGRFPDVMARL